MVDIVSGAPPPPVLSTTFNKIDIEIKRDFLKIE